MTKTWGEWNASRPETPSWGRVFYYNPPVAAPEPGHYEDDERWARLRAPRAARRSTVHAPEAAYARPGSPFVFAARTRRAK